MSPRKTPKKVVRRPNSERINLPEKDNMDGFQVAMVGLFFASCFLTLIYFQVLDLSLFGLLKLLCLFIAISFFVPISFYRKKLTMSFYEYVIFNFISFGPFFLTLMLFFNQTFKSSTYSETYKITQVEHNSKAAIYTLENNTYADKEYLRSIGSNDKVEVSGNQHFTIFLSDGLFGLRIIEKKQLD